jgi:hypothetical protein
MPDTTWEESQKRNPRFRLWILLIIILLGISVAGIIIYNNRDYLSGTRASGSGTVSREVFSTDAVAPKKHGISDRTAALEGNSPREGFSSSAKPGRSKNAADQDSVILKDIRCRVMDRNDITIKMSVRLYFGDAGQRREVLLRCETMAVVARKTVGTTALEDIKIDKIKPVLLREMNAVFEKDMFNDIAIDNITVEKVLDE